MGVGVRAIFSLSPRLARARAAKIGGFAALALLSTSAFVWLAAAAFVSGRG